jgi:CBS domain containing-hemolysin-like protein
MVAPFNSVLLLLAFVLAALLLYVLQQLQARFVQMHKLAGLEPTNYKQWLRNSKRSEEEGSQREFKIFHNAQLFPKVRVRECMIPRTEIEAIDIRVSVEELRQKFITTGFSKLLIYDGSIDQIVGYISSKELFKKPETVAAKLTTVAFAPETMPANQLLHEFMQQHRTMAVVVDEYGGTSGLVTLEDIMEEIFGEIEDEHDTNDLIERVIKENEYVFSGRLEIEYLNSKYGLDIPEQEDYQTLAGYILFNRHNFPKIHDHFKILSFQFKILQATQTRIDLVHIVIDNESK